MGNKIKPRQVALPRNHMVKDMFLIQGSKSGPMKDKRERRASKKIDYRDYQEDWDDEEDFSSWFPASNWNITGQQDFALKYYCKYSLAIERHG